MLSTRSQFSSHEFRSNPRGSICFRGCSVQLQPYRTFCSHSKCPTERALIAHRADEVCSGRCALNWLGEHQPRHVVHSKSKREHSLTTSRLPTYYLLAALYVALTVYSSSRVSPYYISSTLTPFSDYVLFFYTSWLMYPTNAYSHVYICMYLPYLLVDRLVEVGLISGFDLLLCKRVYQTE